MFRTVLRVAGFAIVVGLGGVAPGIAAADQWKVGGVAYAGSATVGGALTLTLASGATTTCTTDATADLSNPGGVAHGTTTSLLLGAPAGGSCVTSVPNCTVSATANTTTPWTITTSATNVTLSGVSITYTYTSSAGQPPCPLAGVPFAATGSITGVASSDIISFTNAGPLSTPLGSATVSGSITAATTGGAAISLS